MLTGRLPGDLQVVESSQQHKSLISKPVQNVLVHADTHCQDGEYFYRGLLREY